MSSTYDIFSSASPAARVEPSSTPLQMRSVGPVPAAVLAGSDGFPAETHHSNEIVRLNVGGTPYSTLYDTLVNSKSKFFEHMFRIDPRSGQIVVFRQNIVEDEDGRIFINRDGRLFAYVLQYMRDGKRTVIPESTDLIRQLVREAEFFAIDRYRTLLLERLTDEERVRNARQETLDSIKSTVQQITQQLYTISFKKT
ncbi:BTB/POZ domain-containing protein KCTD8 [Toxocara canis]|uniref:BTB/POZ domain-containing protein KCTD8 n=2 Tax=Toxocara canis TaxID=6265 RepID=A0A0B2V1Q1_TOXCA|nr:BTB/POZ domain-containing protein KCTD8 [Toxocara canis]VDM23845.1 unnamed protein product [Toxocara canis]